MPSGGRLVFDQTEALMAIDINSGKIGGKTNFEAMAFRTNMEAATAIARQLRLRDIGGQIDPAYAARIHENDRQRIVRALCVYQATGKTFSWWHSQTPPPRDADVLRIGLRLPLDTLTPLLARRIDLMLEAGALEEARSEYAVFPEGTLPGWSGIGCRELHLYLSGVLSLDAARELWINWFSICCAHQPHRVRGSCARAGPSVRR